MGTWTEEEDIKLKDAVQTHGGKNWGAIASLVPGRDEKRCRSRWYNAFNPSIYLATGRSGEWTEDEIDKLKDAVKTHGGKNWDAIASLVPGRTGKQCSTKWYRFLDFSINLAKKRTGTWTEDEDIKLKDAVQTYAGNNWGAIAALVLGRTKSQCSNRWHHFLDPSIALATRCKDSWTSVEDTKLKDAVAVQTNGGNNWDAITALVPGRTKSQC
jgi:hypothetical protein